MEKVLSYHDVLLRGEDLALLQEGQWLNDQLIAFFFEYLAREVHPSLARQLLLVTGATTFLLANMQGAELGSIVGSLQLQSKELVLLAVNDNPYIDQAGGGSHWSLLAYSARHGAFYHYDSAAGSNRRPARQLSERLHAALGGDGKLHFLELPCPQQRNGYDCGVFVLALARLLCGRLEQQGEEMVFGVAGAGRAVQEAVSQLRGELRQLVLAKAAEQQQQAGGS